MKALDTNALVRFLVRDDELQAQAIKNILVDAEKKGAVLFVPFAVTLEMMWVLSSVYEYSRKEILQAFEQMLVLKVFQLEKHETIATLCMIAAHHDADLPDLLIGLVSRDNGCETTLTFDKKAARSGLFTLIA